jgi:hypothetical protein
MNSVFEPRIRRNEMNIEETIQQVENLYERMTGQQVPQGEIKYPVTSNVDPLLVD